MTDSSTSLDDTSYLAAFAASHDEQKVLTYTCLKFNDDTNLVCSVSQGPSINGIYNLLSVVGATQLFTIQDSISVTFKLNGVDQVKSMSFEDDLKCSTIVKNIKITIFVPLENIPAITLKKKNTDSSTVSCENPNKNDSGTEVVCTATLSLGDYELYQVGENSDFSTMEENEITFASDSNPIAQTEQISRIQSIYSRNAKFSFELSDALLYQNLYLNNDKNNLLICSRTEDTSTTVSFTTGSVPIDFNQDNIYKIYYKTCNQLVETGLSIKTDPSRVEVTYFYVMAGGQCTTDPYTPVILDTLSSPGEVTSVTISTIRGVEYFLDICTVGENTIICKPSSPLVSILYKIKEIAGSKTYIMTFSSNSVFDLGSGPYPFTNTQETVQHVGGGIQIISVNLSTNVDSDTDGDGIVDSIAVPQLFLEIQN